MALTALSILTAVVQHQAQNSGDAYWFPPFDFDAATFQKAPRAFGPFTRWWLPGNDLTSEELKREIRMFADNGFAGVEVQPLTMGLNPKAPQAQKDRVYSWNTPSFYEHLGAVMEQAQASGIVVDMNGGSGWPMGGPYVQPAESMKTLAVSDTALAGGQIFSGLLPPPGNHELKAEGRMAVMMGGHKMDDALALATIQSVIAAKVVKTETKQTMLDPRTIVNLTAQVQNRSLTWQAPAGGEWRIVVSWVIPTGESPSLIAAPATSYVIDHLDPMVVRKTYDYLLGDRTGLPKFYHNPMRAVFNDSYEFHTDRMISPDFLPVFKSMNGYDIAPYLSTVFQKGYDHPTYLAAMYPGAKPPFIFFEGESWRMMYDYDKTVNQVFRKNFIQTSDAWMRERGLLHRTQAYGFPADLIGNSGSADIPEAEQLFAEGSEGYLKLVTSGAHLHNRPVVTQESFVSIYRADMTTPQKIKIWADKSFACGVNQLIYHGTPYKYNNGEYGSEGWNTWSSPFTPYINFSTGMNESYPFWKDTKSVNQYLARCQYALRSGKPKTDVLIYFPFVDLTEDQVVHNPEEILNLGYFKGVEPEIKGSGVFEAPKSLISDYYKALWKTVNFLEAHSITWEFVNDESLQQADFKNKDMTISYNNYRALIMANAPYIQLATAKKIHALAKKGMPFFTVGALPAKQPSWLNFEVNDQLTKKEMVLASRQKNSSVLSAKSFEDLLTDSRAVRIEKPASFVRQITRQMADHSEIRFYWNKTDQWQTLSLLQSKSLVSSYFLNPENGNMEEARGAYRLPPYGSVIFYSSPEKKPIAQNILSPSAEPKTAERELSKIDQWNIQAGAFSLKNSSLIDWQTNDSLKFSSAEGVYTALFHLDGKAEKAAYLIDLGKVYFTADVSVNGQAAGTRIFAPYRLDITKFVHSGENTVEVRVTPARRNGLIGEAVKGNPLYAQYKGKENTLLPAGLVGPVIILQQK